MEYMKRSISNDATSDKEEIIVEVVERDEFDEALELYEHGDFSASKDVLNSILASDKKHVDAIALMAQILYDQNQKDIALLFTKKALAIDKSNKIANELEVLLTDKPQEKEFDSILWL